MIRLTASDQLLAELGNLAEAVELYDKAGNKMATIVPDPERRKALYEYARTLFTDEEIERARAESGGITTEELLRRLESLSESEV